MYRKKFGKTANLMRPKPIDKGMDCQSNLLDSSRPMRLTCNVKKNLDSKCYCEACDGESP